MASVLSFDQLHRLRIEEWFAPMDISDEEKQRRADLAEKLEAMFLYYFEAYEDDPERDWGQYLEDVFTTLALAFLGMKSVSAYLKDHIERVVRDFVDVTDRRREDDPYWTSDERAMGAALNQANAVGNYDEYCVAVRNGKTTKTWDTIMDGRERDSHHDENGVTVPISEPFHLPGGDLMYPGDTSLGASVDEIANCRCHVHYN